MLRWCTRMRSYSNDDEEIQQKTNHSTAIASEPAAYMLYSTDHTSIFLPLFVSHASNERDGTIKFNIFYYKTVIDT